MKIQKAIIIDKMRKSLWNRQKKKVKSCKKLILRWKRLDGADSEIKSAFNVRYFTKKVNETKKSEEKSHRRYPSRLSTSPWIQVLSSVP